MIKMVYAINDSKADNFLPPFYARSDAEAERMFTEAVADGNTLMGRFPADFTLFAIGSWDDNSAMFTQDGPPRMLVNGIRVAPPVTFEKGDRTTFEIVAAGEEAS